MATKLKSIPHNGLFILVLLAGCSGGSQQQQQQGDQVSNQNSNNSNQEENQLSNPSLNSNTAKAAQGAAMNNATTGATNNFSGANAGTGEAVNNALLDNPTMNPMAENPTAVPLNQSTPLNAGNNQALSNTTTPPPSNTAPVAESKPAPTSTERMNASPYANPQMNWPGKGKVKYVTRRATRHATPNGPVVGEMETGEHPLIYQNGNWVELHDGTFIKGNSMTDTPTGYERRASH